MNTRELTYGERMVGLTFNPSNDQKVRAIKELCAKLIDILVEDSYTSAEVTMMQEFAIKTIMTAQMWAVKVVTFKYVK